MAWLSAIFKAILEWASAEIKKDTKASDADKTPEKLKKSWRRNEISTSNPTYLSSIPSRYKC